MTTKKNSSLIHASAAEYLTYVAATGDAPESYEMRYQDENIWLTQKMMAALYGVGISTINEHIQRIYADGELIEDATIRKYRIVQQEGNRQATRNLDHYNLQMIIAVGFKVNEEEKKRGIVSPCWGWPLSFCRTFLSFSYVSRSGQLQSPGLCVRLIVVL